MGGAYGGKGPMTNAVLWVEVVVFGFFVALRLYTRKVILNTVGVDDFLVMIAFVSCNMSPIFESTWKES